MPQPRGPPQIETNGYDRELLPQWVETLATLVAPFRYPGHALMMIAAYVAQMAPGGRIVVAATFQAGDEARRVERLAYRVRQIQLAFPGFAADSKSIWEQDQRWQPLRQFVERLLVTYDWGEAFVALNLVLKPMIDDLFLNRTSDLALGHDDHLLGQIFYSLNEDCQWHRQWSQALTLTAIEDIPTNRQLIQTWINKWYPRALRAVDAFLSFIRRRVRGPRHASVSRSDFPDCLAQRGVLKRHGSPARFVERRRLTQERPVLYTMRSLFAWDAIGHCNSGSKMRAVYMPSSLLRTVGPCQTRAWVSIQQSLRIDLRPPQLAYNT